MPTYNDAIGDKMAFAVDVLIRERIQNKSRNTPEELTKLFWDALVPFANAFLNGTVDFVRRSDGAITIRFTPKK